MKIKQNKLYQPSMKCPISYHRFIVYALCCGLLAACGSNPTNNPDTPSVTVEPSDTPDPESSQSKAEKSSDSPASQQTDHQAKQSIPEKKPADLTEQAPTEMPQQQSDKLESASVLNNREELQRSLEEFDEKQCRTRSRRPVRR